jgi:hypothetical protein
MQRPRVASPQLCHPRMSQSLGIATVSALAVSKARANFGDILAAIGRGDLTPDEGNMIGALIERRANLFQTIELQDEIASPKASSIMMGSQRYPRATKSAAHPTTLSSTNLKRLFNSCRSPSKLSASFEKMPLSL